MYASCNVMRRCDHRYSLKLCIYSVIDHLLSLFTLVILSGRVSAVAKVDAAPSFLDLVVFGVSVGFHPLDGDHLLPSSPNTPVQV